CSRAKHQTGRPQRAAAPLADAGELPVCQPAPKSSASNSPTAKPAVPAQTDRARCDCAPGCAARGGRSSLPSLGDLVEASDQVSLERAARDMLVAAMVTTSCYRRGQPARPGVQPGRAAIVSLRLNGLGVRDR